MKKTQHIPVWLIKWFFSSMFAQSQSAEAGKKWQQSK
jgi:hypothetical protein